MSDEFSVFEELMNTMRSHYVQTMQKEMQKVLKKVHEMPTESWREQALSLVGNVVFELMMMDTKPNYCIVMNNSVDQTVYVSRYPSASASNFEFKVQPGTRIQWLWGRGIDRLYFFAAGNANVFVQSYVSDFNPAAVNMLQTQSQIIANTVANPVPTSVVGSLANQINFQSAATATDNGTSLTVNGLKNLTVGISSASGNTARTIEFHGVDAAGNDNLITGVNKNGLAMGTSTTNTGETWQFDITGLVTVYMKLTAITSGNVTVTGLVVA